MPTQVQRCTQIVMASCHALCCGASPCPVLRDAACSNLGAPIATPSPAESSHSTAIKRVLPIVLLGMRRFTGRSVPSAAEGCGGAIRTHSTLALDACLLT